MKRIFYLSTSGKIQFFKSFILPYFDCCRSLLIYFPKSILQKLSSLYYLCIIKLFKINFISDSIETNQFLKLCNLFSLQHRIFRFPRFSTRIYLDDNAPLSLCSQLRVKVLNSVNPVVCSFTKELRYNRTLTISETYNTKFGEFTFEKCCVYAIPEPVSWESSSIPNHIININIS